MRALGSTSVSGPAGVLLEGVGSAFQAVGFVTGSGCVRRVFIDLPQLVHRAPLGIWPVVEDDDVNSIADVEFAVVLGRSIECTVVHEREYAPTRVVGHWDAAPCF